MSKRSLRKRVESEVGYAIFQEVFDQWLDRFGDDQIEDPVEFEDDAFQVAVDHFHLIKPMIGQAKPVKNRQPGSTRGNYGTSFEKRYALYIFVEGEKIKSREIAQKIWGPGPRFKWADCYARYKQAINPLTGLPFDHIPPSFDAFRMCYRRAAKELDNLTAEDMDDLSVQAFFDAISDLENGRPSSHPISENFEVIRRKRSGQEPSWRGVLNAQTIWSYIEQLVIEQSPANRQTKSELNNDPGSVMSDPDSQTQTPEDIQKEEEFNAFAGSTLTGLSTSLYEKALDHRIETLTGLLSDYQNGGIPHQDPKKP